MMARWRPSNNLLHPRLASSAMLPSPARSRDISVCHVPYGTDDRNLPCLDFLPSPCCRRAAGRGFRHRPCAARYRRHGRARQDRGIFRAGGAHRRRPPADGASRYRAGQGRPGTPARHRGPRRPPHRRTGIPAARPAPAVTSRLEYSSTHPGRHPRRRARLVYSLFLTIDDRPTHYPAAHSDPPQQGEIDEIRPGIARCL